MHSFIEKLESRTLLATVNVNQLSTQQTIQSLGGNYAVGQFQGVVQDSVGRYTLTNLKPKDVRVQLPVAEWEPANDNTSSSSFNWANFKDTGKVHSLFLMLKDFQAQGKNISAAVFNAPNWMVTSATVTRYNQRVLRPEMYTELIESMAAFLKKAKDTYGVTIKTVSINEADGGYRVLLSASQYANLVKLGGAKFASLGLTTKWVIGDSYYTKGAYDYAKNILAVSGVKQYAAAISYHSWWSETLSDGEWTRMRSLGQQYGLPIWANEVGFFALASKQQPYLFKNWEGARRLAHIYNKVLRLSGATQLLYWQYQKDFPLLEVSSTTGAATLYPSYYIVKLLVDNIQPGSKILNVSSDSGSIMPLAAKDTAHNKFITQAINFDKTAISVTFKGLPNQPMTLIKNANGINSQNLGTRTPVNGTLTVTMAADSVLTLTGKLTSTTTTATAAAMPAQIYTANAASLGGSFANLTNDAGLTSDRKELVQ